ncbi:MAG: hypothetical protein R3321_02620 [Nitrososphaeraceae archaeon]|nr:hypothetical protein [Nitrososphaeraceae archaeon]
MLSSEVTPPSSTSLKTLDISDIAIMNELSYILRDKILESFNIDPFTIPDPFDNVNDLFYNILIDKENPNRIIAIIATFKISDEQTFDLRDLNLDRLQEIKITEEKAKELKHQLMPKNTNNFYSIRQDGKIFGYIMFAFQICGQND